MRTLHRPQAAWRCMDNGIPNLAPSLQILQSGLRPAFTAITLVRIPSGRFDPPSAHCSERIKAQALPHLAHCVLNVNGACESSGE